MDCCHLSLLAANANVFLAPLVSNLRFFLVLFLVVCIPGRSRQYVCRLTYSSDIFYQTPYPDWVVLYFFKYGVLFFIFFLFFLFFYICCLPAAAAAVATPAPSTPVLRKCNHPVLFRQAVRRRHWAKFCAGGGDRLPYEPTATHTFSPFLMATLCCNTHPPHTEWKKKKYVTRFEVGGDLRSRTVVHNCQQRTLCVP